MKRTRLARRTPLVAKTPLKPGVPLVRRSPMPRCSSELRSTSAPARRAAPLKQGRGHQVPRSVTQIVDTRSGGLCEIQLWAVCLFRATQRHHRITTKAGGRKGAAAKRHDRASNIVATCDPCHEQVTYKRVRVAGMGVYALGLSLREHQEPTQVNVLYRGERMWLDDAGNVHDFAEGVA